MTCSCCLLTKHFNIWFSYIGRAQECFLRALELDPNEADALVALAVMELGAASQIVVDYEEDETGASSLEKKKSLVQK